MSSAEFGTTRTWLSIFQAQTNNLIYYSGAFAVGLLAYPLDTIRTNIQANQSAQNIRMRDVFQKMKRREIIPFRGILSVIMMQPLVDIVTLATLKLSTFALNSQNYSVNVTERAMLFGCAVIVAGYIRAPMEVIKQRSQVGATLSSGIISVIYDGNASVSPMSSWEKISLTETNPSGTLRGMQLSNASMLGVWGIHRLIYDYIIANDTILSINQNHQLGKHQKFFAACTSAAVAAFITCPLSVIQTQLQVYPKDQPKGHLNAKTAAKVIWRTAGLRAFWRGAVARMLWIAPAVAYTEVMYS